MASSWFFSLRNYKDDARFHKHKNHEVLYNVAARIWDPRWLTILCCDSYRVHNMTYICCTVVMILGSSMWRVLFPGAVVHWLGFWLCPLWLYWFSCFLVSRRMGWECGGGGVPVHLFFVVCYRFLFWIGCFVSNYFFCETVAGFFVQYWAGFCPCVAFPSCGGEWLLLYSCFDWNTGCPRRNVPDFGRVFLRSNYTDITQNTYIQSWTVTEIMAREVWNFGSYYSLIDYQIHIETGRNMWFL